MEFWYSCIKLIFRTYLTIFTRGVRVSSEQPIQKHPKIIAANHPNASDVFTLPSVFPDRLHALVQGNVFEAPFWGWLLKKSDQIPVWPGKGKNAIQTACERIQAGHSVIVFPEGRLNPNNQELKCGIGAVRIALETGAPIVPLGFYVADEHTYTWKKEKNGVVRQGRWQVRGRCFVRIGEPWFPGQESVRFGNRLNPHQLTEQLMTQIRLLAHQAKKESQYENRLPCSGISSHG